MHESRSPRAEYVQREAAAILYQRLIMRQGPATVETLADQLGVHHSTVTRQCNGDIPVTLRTLVAFAAIDPDGGRAVSALTMSELGFELRPALHAVADGSDVEAASHLGDRAGHAAMLLCRFLGDGRLDETEREALLTALPKLEWALKRAQAALAKEQTA